MPSTVRLPGQGIPILRPESPWGTDGGGAQSLELRGRGEAVDPVGDSSGPQQRTLIGGSPKSADHNKRNLAGTDQGVW
jgi:hypothetical protein